VTDALTTQQRQWVVVAWLTYAGFYLGRFNLSPAVPTIAEDLNVSLGTVGILGSVFFWCYAVGQIISGQLGNIIRPRIMISAGMLLVIIANLLFAFGSILWVLTLIWAINGFGQSAGWGPMLRILNTRLSVSQQKRLSPIFSMTFQIGTAAAWALATVMIYFMGWRSAFWMPAIILLGWLVVWWWYGLDADVATTQTAYEFRFSDLITDLRQFAFPLIAASCTGFVYISFQLWLPTLLDATDFLPELVVLSITAIIPLIGILGMQLTSILLGRGWNVFDINRILLILMAVALLAAGFTRDIVQLVLITVGVLLGSGLIGLFLSTLPILIGEQRVSSAAGLFTASWSIAGGFSSIVVGTIVDRQGWGGVYPLWVGLLVAALIAIVITQNQHKQQERIA